MLSPSRFGSDIERRVRELRALPEPWKVQRERSPRQRRSRRRFRAAFGARLIAWGESLTCGIPDAPVGRVSGQPS